MKTIKIGMLGCGTVGSGVWKILTERQSLLEERTGCRFELRKILVRDLAKRRPCDPPATLLTTNAAEILADPEIDIVVELMGGVSPAISYLTKALEQGKKIVTANKRLLAERGGEIFRLASEREIPIGFEASVAGGIPILRAIREGFVGNRIEEIYGIVNGTSNYILSGMTERGIGFEEALREAQGKGYAESDSRMDIDGDDAAQKLAILIALASGRAPELKKITVEGIQKITPFDVESAKRMGFVIKLLAIYKVRGDAVEARVHPTFIPKSHPLADVGGIFNAIFLKGDAVGPAMFYGQGAGMMPTASAVVSDIVAVSRVEKESWRIRPVEARYLPPDDLVTEYYLRFSVVDRPGVLAQIASSLGSHEISISSVHQYEQSVDAKVPILVMVHAARERNVRKAIEEIDRFESVLDRTLAIRVERL